MDKKELMKSLGITAVQAEELMTADSNIDRMSKVSDINGDLTPIQAQASKKARSSARKRTSYKFDSNKEKKENEPKREIIAALVAAVGEVDNIEVINPEREFVFTKSGTRYRVTLSLPRS